MFGTPDSVLATVDHDIHRQRRNVYLPFFSKQSIRDYTNVIQSCIDKFCSKLEESHSKGDVVNLNHAYTALAGDVVSGYCYPASYGLLDLVWVQPRFP